MGVPTGILTLITFPAIVFKALPSPFSQIDVESLLSFMLFQHPRPLGSWQTPTKVHLRCHLQESFPASSLPVIQHT